MSGEPKYRILFESNYKGTVYPRHIRDDGGIVVTFPTPHYWEGQQERYEAETKELFRIAETTLAALNGATPPDFEIVPDCNKPPKSEMSGEKELKPSPGLAPAYCAIYPDMAELVREHGYALSIHGSLRRDFDLVCIPWADKVSAPEEVVEAIAKAFAFERDPHPTQKNHGRICYTIHISWGECRFDLSFVLQSATPPGVEMVPEGTKALLDAAIRFIDVHPCDPDITKEQREAWGVYSKLLTAHRAAQKDKEPT